MTCSVTPISRKRAHSSSNSARFAPSQPNWIDRRISDGSRPTEPHASSSIAVSSVTLSGSPPAMFQTSAWRATSRSGVAPEAPTQIGGGGARVGVGCAGAAFLRWWGGGWAGGAPRAPALVMDGGGGPHTPPAGLAPRLYL